MNNKSENVNNSRVTFCTMKAGRGKIVRIAITIGREVYPWMKTQIRVMK
jgi:hypothetical protein